MPLNGRRTASGEVVRVDIGGRTDGPCASPRKLQDAAGAPAARRAPVAEPDEAAITGRLCRLATAYPAFSFSYAVLGRKGRRWTAERTDQTASGLRVVITGDLMELHKALQPYKAGRVR